MFIWQYSNRSVPCYFSPFFNSFLQSVISVSGLKCVVESIHLEHSLISSKQFATQRKHHREKLACNFVLSQCRGVNLVCSCDCLYPLTTRNHPLLFIHVCVAGGDFATSEALQDYVRARYLRVMLVRFYSSATAIDDFGEELDHEPFYQISQIAVSTSFGNFLKMLHLIAHLLKHSSPPPYLHDLFKV